ncbi:transcription termination factor MTEF1, chloroplastic-like [Camellia sinensis]|uniref:transcription termination factor MTEF1, chloroplastic-like n=1 Tax=Camellia sinensis TaxID=4442 RepID=UPI0010362332|nr:transcription termination factor MTEF1, chloroplastic-like [Camellia sinensis]
MSVVRSFLGLVGYYKKFVKDFSKIAVPLTQLTQKGVSYEWTEDGESAFLKLKTRLVSVPILILPSSNEEFQIYSDTSYKGLGCKNNDLTPTTTTDPPQPTFDSGLRFREKLLYLQTLKVNPSKALHKNPNFQSAPLDSLKSIEKCLSSMGIDRSALGRIFDMYPQLLTCDPYSDLYPVFDFLLNHVNIPFPDIRISIIRCPRLLICSVDHQLRPALRFLENLGFVGKHALTCQTTLLLVSNVKNMFMPKLNYLQDLGFSYEEVLRSPGLLTFSISNNFEPKVEYFLKEMNGNLAELKMFLQYFSFSLEGKIKPRHQLLMEIGLSLSLPQMLKVSDGEFNARLIEMRLRLVDQRQSQ